MDLGIDPPIKRSYGTLRQPALSGALYRANDPCPDGSFRLSPRARSLRPLLAQSGRSASGRSRWKRKAWLTSLSCRKPKQLGYPHDLWRRAPVPGEHENGRRASNRARFVLRRLKGRGRKSRNRASGCRRHTSRISIDSEIAHEARKTIPTMGNSVVISIARKAGRTSE